jgi:anaerobic magnesium-protoporphyrin IX monomethyl ester cyclase
VKILLIRAGRANLSHYNITYPMGLMYLAAVARRAHAAAVRIVDCRFPWNGTARIVHELRTMHPEVVGLSSLTQDAPHMHQVAALVRRHAPWARIVVGGPHPTILPRPTIADENIDAVVTGEGERAFVELLGRFAAGREDDGVPGVWTRSTHPTARAEAVEDLDELPAPAWDLVDMRPYSLWPTMAPVGVRRYRSIVTSRGCPYGCIFCHRNHGKRFRPHSPGRVLEELERGAREGRARDIEVVDDVFNLDRRRVEAIAEGVLRADLRLRFQFPNGLRSDLLDDPLLALMRRMGTNWISFAIETANERLQRLIGKRLKLERAREAIAAASRLGIFCDGFFMIGFPTETEEEARRTVRFALESALHSAKFFIVVPFPETELCTRYASPPTGVDRDALRRYDYFYTRENLSAMSDHALHAVVREANQRFYREPRRLWRTWHAHPMPIFLPFFGGVVAWRGLLARLRA